MRTVRGRRINLIRVINIITLNVLSDLGASSAARQHTAAASHNVCSTWPSSKVTTDLLNGKILKPDLSLEPQNRFSQLSTRTSRSG